MRKKSILTILWVSMLLFLLACGEKEYLIEFITNGGNEIENQIIKNGETLVFPATTKEGYTFDNWYLDVDFEESFSEKSEITSDLKLYAKWIANTYAISFETNSEIEKETIAVAYDQSLQIDDLISDDFNQFQGWFLDAEFNESFNAEERPASDITLYAKWMLDYSSAYNMITQFDIIEINFNGFNREAQFIFKVDSVYAKLIDHKEDYKFELYAVGSNEQTLVYYKESSEVYWTLEIEDVPYENSVYFEGINDMINLIPSNIDTGNYLYDEGTFSLVSTYLEQIENELSSVLYDIDLFYLPYINLVSHELKIVQDRFELTYHVLQSNEPLIFTFSNVNQVIFPELDLQVNTEDYVQGVTENQIFVGTSIPTSGMMAMIGAPFLVGMQAYFNYINDLGGVSNRQIELIHYDNQFDTYLGSQQVSELIHYDKVFGLVGLLGTSVVNATTGFIQEVGIPSIYPVSSSNISHASTNQGWSIFPVQPTNYLDGVNIARHAITEPIYGINGNNSLGSSANIGILYSQDEMSLEIYLGVMSELVHYEYTVYTGSVDNNANTIAYQVASLANQNISTLIIVSPTQLFQNIVYQVESQSFNVPIFTSYINAVPLNLDSRSSLDVYANAWLGYYSTHGIHDYFQIMLEQGLIDYVNNPYAMSGYIAAYIFVEGLIRVGDQELTWKTYIEAMEQSPIMIPLGGYVDYANGLREGASLSLIKYNASNNRFEGIE